jgi:hypothetical protein
MLANVKWVAPLWYISIILIRPPKPISSIYDKIIIIMIRIKRIINSNNKFFTSGYISKIKLIPRYRISKYFLTIEKNISICSLSHLRFYVFNCRVIFYVFGQIVRHKPKIVLKLIHKTVYVLCISIPDGYLAITKFQDTCQCYYLIY